MNRVSIQQIVREAVFTLPQELRKTGILLIDCNIETQLKHMGREKKRIAQNLNSTLKLVMEIAKFQKNGQIWTEKETDIFK